VDDANLGVMNCELVSDRACRVRTPIVDDDDLEVVGDRSTHSQGVARGCLHMGLLVVARKEHGKAQSGGKRWHHP
jgi:hypothetical protein